MVSVLMAATLGGGVGYLLGCLIFVATAEGLFKVRDLHRTSLKTATFLGAVFGLFTLFFHWTWRIEPEALTRVCG